MDVSSLPANNSRAVTPTRGGEKREQRDNTAPEQMSQAEARRRAQEQEQMRRAQERRDQQQDVATRIDKRLGGRFVKVAKGQQQTIENTEAARADVMRNKIERTYTDNKTNTKDSIDKGNSSQKREATGSFRSENNQVSDDTGDAIDFVV